MPELPEVETIVNDLARSLVGEKIIGFSSVWEKAIKLNFTQFRQQIIGRQIIGVQRRGKCIIIKLDGEVVIVAHLKMTGHLLYKKLGAQDVFFKEKVNQYIRHIFDFQSGARLEFCDLRKFGWILACRTDEWGSLKEIKQLGVEPLESGFTKECLRSIINRFPKKIIGALLLEQNLIAGIGNIYRSEILFKSKIKPHRIASSLSADEIGVLHRKIIQILKEAIKYRGTSDSDFRDLDGRPGNFQHKLAVYRRAKHPCVVCGAPIVSAKI